MNVYEIEALVRAADQLRNYSSGTKGDKVHDQILDRVASELGKVETADEVATLQKSSDIKQANLNLLAGKVIEAINDWGSNKPVSIHFKRLKALAESLIQEEPNPGTPG